jgi:hypothetical protein
MSDLRAAAQQGLDAIYRWHMTDGETADLMPAFEALRATLAQPAASGEPVAWRSENANPPGGYVIFQQYPQALADLGKPIQPLYTAPRA